MRKNGSYREIKGQSNTVHAVKSKKIEVYEKEIKNAISTHKWNKNKP
jgi:hypothetical protein